MAQHLSWGPRSFVGPDGLPPALTLGLPGSQSPAHHRPRWACGAVTRWHNTLAGVSPTLALLNSQSPAHHRQHWACRTVSRRHITANTGGASPQMPGLPNTHFDITYPFLPGRPFELAIVLPCSTARQVSTCFHTVLLTSVATDQCQQNMIGFQHGADHPTTPLFLPGCPFEPAIVLLLRAYVSTMSC